MNPEIKTRWLCALRSKLYTQGTGYLRRNGRFCCLGVLLDQIDENRWTIWDEELNCFEYQYGDCSHEIVPLDLAREIGLDRAIQSELATMNDDGKSFEKIANWIEENI